jgi:DNA-binding NtrC family response regulator
MPEGLSTAERELRSVPAPPPRLDEARRKFEIRYVEDLLARTGGNIAAAARIAGISRPNFHKKLRVLGVDAARFKRRWWGRRGPPRQVGRQDSRGDASDLR